MAASNLATATPAVKHVGWALTFRLAKPCATTFAVSGGAVTGAIDTAVARAVQAAVPWARTLSVNLSLERDELREVHTCGIGDICLRFGTVGRFGLSFTMATSLAATFAAPGTAVARAIDTAIARAVKAAVAWALTSVLGFVRNTHASKRKR